MQFWEVFKSYYETLPSYQTEEALPRTMGTIGALFCGTLGLGYAAIGIGLVGILWSGSPVPLSDSDRRNLYCAAAVVILAMIFIGAYYGYIQGFASALRHMADYPGVKAEASRLLLGPAWGPSGLSVSSQLGPNPSSDALILTTGRVVTKSAITSLINAITSLSSGCYNALSGMVTTLTARESRPRP